MNYSKIADERKKLGLSQEELAEKVGVSQKSISKYERGARRPSYETLKKMASVFGVTTDFLLDSKNVVKSTKDELFFFFFNNEIRDKFVSQLNNALAMNDMSIEALSEATSIEYSDCLAYSKGEYEPPIEHLVAISRALDISVDFLLGQSDTLVEKAMTSFRQLSEDNKDIIVGEIKKALRDQRYESVAAEEIPRKVSGK